MNHCEPLWLIGQLRAYNARGADCEDSSRNKPSPPHFSPRETFFGRQLTTAKRLGLADAGPLRSQGPVEGVSLCADRATEIIEESDARKSVVAVTGRRCVLLNAIAKDGGPKLDLRGGQNH
jgi:hypothetical protein